MLTSSGRTPASSTRRTEVVAAREDVGRRHPRRPVRALAALVPRVVAVGPGLPYPAELVEEVGDPVERTCCPASRLLS